MTKMEQWSAIMDTWPVMMGMTREHIVKFLQLLEKDLNTYDEIITLAHKYEKNYDYDAMDEMDALEHFQKFHTGVFTLCYNTPIYTVNTEEGKK